MEQNIIPILMCFNDEVFVDACVAIQSIIEHSNINNIYEFNLYFDTKKENYKKILEDIITQKGNGNVIYRDAQKIINNYALMEIPNYANISYHACMRLFIPFELEGVYSKILYTDVDVVVTRDIAEMYNIDIGNNWVGAIKEYFNCLLYNKILQCSDEYTKQITDFYQQNNLDFQKSVFAGNLIFNIEEICKNINTDNIKKAISEAPMLYDQLALNKLFYNHIYFINPTWCTDIRYYEEVSKALLLTEVSDILDESFYQGFFNPSIIHYVSPNKPLVSKQYRLCEKYYWETASHLSFFDQIVKIKRYCFEGFNPNVYLNKKYDKILWDDNSKVDLSIIVPCHNVEKYIKFLINDFAQQNMNDINVEYIFVIDNCTDQTKDFVEQAELSNKSIIECCVNNPGSARNIGLNAAIGNYIWFIDSDDRIINSFAFKNILEIFAQNKYLHKIEINYNYSLGFNKLWANSVWRFIYSRKFLLNNNIQFAQKSWGEDELFNTLVSKAEQQLNLNPYPFYFKTPLYYYNYLRVGSLTYDLYNQ